MEIIKLENISKFFILSHQRGQSFRENFINLFSVNKTEKFTALDNITLSINQGEFFGIIGKNGSGKSTLLKILAKVYIPDSGKVSINATIAPFLELGIGFHPELSARDNIYLNGVILGMSKKQISAKFNEIIEFADLIEFVDMKIKHYSSGMYARLAFSIATQVHADVLILDEVLAVGDANFQKKCFDIFKLYKDAGKTIIFVSHGLENIRQFCDRVLVLDRGEDVFCGNPQEALNHYNNLLSI